MEKFIKVKINQLLSSATIEQLRIAYILLLRVLR